MPRSKTRSGIVSGILLPMGLICLFAFCSLALALMGGRAYKEIQGRVNDGYGTTVAAGYLRTKLAQNNAAGAVSLRDEDGAQVLVIANATQDATHETRIFMYQGKLVENFVVVGAPFDAMGANTIAELQSCAFDISEEGLFTAVLVDMKGEETRTAFALTEGGAV